MPLEIEVVDDPGRACSAMLVGVAAGGGHIVLTGGSTPRAAYGEFVDAVDAVGIDVSACTMWFGDERCVPPDDERRQQLVGSLSGGEQQMLAFGRAMMAQPVLLMLDEPSLGLAPIMVEEVARAIDYFRESGVTILLVEQNAELALELATRGYVIETGSIVLADTSVRLLENPKVWASYLGEQDWEFDTAAVAQSPQ